MIPRVEVQTNFSGGSAAPTVTFDGTDAEGNSITWTATVTGGNNPTAAVSTTLSADVLTAAARVTVQVGSLSGIVAGSVLIVSEGLVDEERILVESIDSGATTITAVFLRNHDSGATLTGFRTFTATPGTAGRRVRTVTAITIGVTGHTTGQVRVTGVPDRIAI